MRILLCTDGSPEAAEAVRFGFQLARGSQQPVKLLGVVEKRVEVDAMRAALEDLGAEIKTIGARCETKVRRGHAAEQILAEAEAWQAELIVVGQLGWRGLTRFLMGTTAARILHYADCSVLLYKGHHATVHNILVGTAGSEQGLRNVARAGQVAQQAQAAVTVLHVMSQVPISERAYLPDLTAAADELITRQTREGLHLKAALAKLRETAPDSARWVKVRHGFVVDEILAELREGRYDLLVVGAHVARGLNRWLLDDVTAHLVAASPTPVLVAKGK